MPARCHLLAAIAHIMSPLHVTSIFRSTEQLNIFHFLLMRCISSEEMLLEIVSPGEEHPRTQHNSLGGHSVVPWSPWPGKRPAQARPRLPSSQRVKRHQHPGRGLCSRQGPPVPPWPRSRSKHWVFTSWLGVGHWPFLIGLFIPIRAVKGLSYEISCQGLSWDSAELKRSGGRRRREKRQRLKGQGSTKSHLLWSRSSDKPPRQGTACCLRAIIWV